MYEMILSYFLHKTYPMSVLFVGEWSSCREQCYNPENWLATVNILLLKKETQ